MNLTVLLEYLQSAKTFDRFVFGHAERIIEVGQTVVCGFGLLPGFASRVAGHRGLVALGLVLVDAFGFAGKFVGAEWYGHVEFMYVPFSSLATE